MLGSLRAGKRPATGTCMLYAGRLERGERLEAGCEAEAWAVEIVQLREDGHYRERGAI